MPKSKKIIFFTAIAALLAFASFRMLAPRPVEVDLAEVQRGPFEISVHEDGRTRVKDRYVVSAPTAGRIARLQLHPGDDVADGQVLTRIVPLDPPLLDARSRAELRARVRMALAVRRQASAAIEQARAAHQFSAEEAKRLRALEASKAVSRQLVERGELDEKSTAKALESAIFAGRVADHELELAEAALQRLEKPAAEEYVDVTSPVRGRMLRVFQESEGVIAAGTPLMEIGDPSALEVVSDLLTADAVRVRPGAPVTLEGWGGPGQLRGRVRLIEPAAFTKVSALGIEEQRVNVVIELDGPPESWSALGDGYRVEVNVRVYEKEEALKVPLSALFRVGDKWKVYAVRNSRAVTTSVGIERLGAREAELRDGLAPGDRVILHPGDKIRDDVAVTSRSEAR